MRLLVRTILVLLYSLFVLANSYVIYKGGFSTTRAIFLALCLLAIVAVSGKGGSGTRFWAYMLSGFLAIGGCLLSAYSIWAHASDVPNSPTAMYSGPLLVLMAVATYWVIKTGNHRPFDHAAELEPD